MLATLNPETVSERTRIGIVLRTVERLIVVLIVRLNIFSPQTIQNVELYTTYKITPVRNFRVEFRFQHT